MTDSVKTLNGIAYTSAKTVQGIAKAAIKSWGGIAAAPPNTYATWNASDIDTHLTLSNGDLTAVSDANVSWKTVRANQGKASGKWYFEVTVDADTVGHVFIGTCDSAGSLTNYVGSSSQGWSYRGQSYKYNNDVETAFGSSFTTGAIISCYFDMDNGKIGFYNAGVDKGFAFASGLTGTQYPAITLRSTDDQITVNFGATAFTYSPPSGYNSGVYV